MRDLPDEIIDLTLASARLGSRPALAENLDVVRAYRAVYGALAEASAPLTPIAPA